MQHRSGKATSRIMSFLGLGPKIVLTDSANANRDAPRRKKKKKKKAKKVRRTATAPAAPAPGGDAPDSADEASRVFIKRKPIEKMRKWPAQRIGKYILITI